jgi:hypothetical protein
MEIAKIILDFISAIIWPVVVITIVLMFRKQISNRLQDIKELELPGGFKATLNEVKKFVVGSKEVSEKKVSAKLVEHSFELNITNDLQLSVFNARINIEKEISRMIQLSQLGFEFQEINILNKIDKLSELKWINNDTKDSLRKFISITNQVVHSQIKSEDELNEALKISSIIYYHIRYIRIIRELLDNFNGNMLWQTDKGVNNKKYHIFSAIASEAQLFDYSYEAFCEAANLFNEKNPEVHHNWRPGGHIIIPSMQEYVNILKFRASEISRYINVKSDEMWRKDFNEWHWPKEWETTWNRPLSSLGNSYNEMHLELLKTNSAINLYENKLLNVN